jgi:putative molybdopterin biosynthesis protein
MHRISLNYALVRETGRTGDAQSPEASSPRDLHHPLMALLAAIHGSGSISGAARTVGLSYRHVWGELKRWEAELGQTLVMWSKGQPATLSPFGTKLLWAERQAQARLAPQIEAMRIEIERAFAVVFDDTAGLIPMVAGHDMALPRLLEWLQSRHRLHIDLQFSGSVDALAALNEGRCLLAGFHALTAAPLNSPTARTYRPMLKPGRHKLIGFAQRNQGLMVARGNPQGITTLADLTRPGLRFVHRPRGTGTRVVLEEMLESAGVSSDHIDGFDCTQPSHEAAATMVASGDADAAFGIETAAIEAGLDFVPMARENYYLTTLAEHLSNPHLETLLGVLRSAEWRAHVEGIPGYTAAGSGQVLSLRAVLPWWSYRQPKRPTA